MQDIRTSVENGSFSELYSKVKKAWQNIPLTEAARDSQSSPELLPDNAL